ncbi:MAG: HAD family hydrolase [Erysipelotrichaceae bacterium]|nr:HAD family hydrolase [Erysipelotrichaceae bacterium]
MTKKIIFLDVDGTLIDYEQKLPSSARQAVIDARKNGHRVYICTGCSRAEIDSKHWDFELDGMIGGDGAYVEDHGKVIMHQRLTEEQVRHVVDWCTERGIIFREECNSGMYICDGYEEGSLQARIAYMKGKGADVPEGYRPPLPSHMISGANMIRDDVNKFSFVLRTYQDHLDSIKEFPDLKAGTWGGVGEAALYGDLGVKNINKAHAINVLLDYIHADAKDAVAFGDAKVDIPMFECCGYSVAMGNAGKECKEAADYITDDINEDGLANAFRHLGLID